MYSHHPPTVVTLHQGHSGRRTPETESPLSSTPNSPRSSPEGHRHGHAESGIEGTPDWEHKQMLQRIGAPILPSTPEAPFDESGVLVPDDEKKVDEGDELMGPQTPHHRVQTTNSRKPIMDGETPKEDEASEPPSLAVDAEQGSKPPTESTLEPNSTKITVDLDSTKEDDDSQPPSLAAAMDAEDNAEHEPPKESTQEPTANIVETPMDTPLNPSKASDNDVNLDSYTQEPVTPAVVPTEAIVTPVQDVKSPPQVQKQSMDWEAGDSAPTTKENTENAESYREPKTVENLPSVNKLPEEEKDGVPEENGWNEDAPGDENEETETPRMLRPMLSPDGTIDYLRRQKPHSVYDSLHNKVMEEFEGVISGDTEEENGVVMEPDETERSTPIADNLSPVASFDEQNSRMPFHPTGAVGIEERPETLARSVSEPVVPDHHSTVLQEFTNTLSDAVDLAATSAAAMGDLLLTSAKCEPKEIPQVEGPDVSRPPLQLEGRSVSDVPRSAGSLIGSGHSTMDWHKYLENKPDGMPTTAGTVDVSQWMLGSGSAHTLPSTRKRQGYREMTPKKDFQSSEKSAAWLQEEFKRRSTIKKEINDAILARNDLPSQGLKDLESSGRMSEYEASAPPQGAKEPTASVAVDNVFADELTKALQALPPQLESSTLSDLKDVSQQSDDDDEVAALTTAATADNGSLDKGLLPTKSDTTGTQPDDDDQDSGKPKPRRLDYGSTDGRGEPGPAVGATAPAPAASAPGPRQPAVSRVAEVLASPGVFNTKIAPSHKDPNLENDLQHQMQLFVSNTRAALREQVPQVVSTTATGEDENLTNAPFKSLAIANSTRGPDGLQSIEADTSFKPRLQVNNRGGNLDVGVDPSASRGSEAVSEGSEFRDIESATPVLVQSMDSVFGVAKGDIVMSLLNENTGRAETSKFATWANRVHGAIWRCRRMRRSHGEFPSVETVAPDGSPTRGRSSLPVDMDKARVAGGVKSVQSTQEAALVHLQHDEIDEALDLFEDIIFAYYSFFERLLKAREANPGKQKGSPLDFKAYIGVALHNLGILNLLNGDYKSALSYFDRALENRRSCLGEGHPDHLASLVKLAICHYALNEFAEAHARLEEALVFAREGASTLEDRIQMAEILNNLGCLAYMCGQPVAANSFYRESMDVQFSVLTESLYQGPASLGQSISLNISITRANIGFVKLVTKDLPVAVTALENALMEQQTLLRGANDTVVATMDHLAVANLLNGEQEKADQMFGRILNLQQSEYGPHDRRCYVTMDKITMVRSQGTNFEQAIEELRKTFTMPVSPRQPAKSSSSGAKADKKENKASQSPSRSDEAIPAKSKGQKSKVLRVLTSMRKKKTKPETQNETRG